MMAEPIPESQTFHHPGNGYFLAAFFETRLKATVA